MLIFSQVDWSRWQESAILTMGKDRDTRFLTFLPQEYPGHDHGKTIPQEKRCNSSHSRHYYRYFYKISQIANYDLSGILISLIFFCFYRTKFSNNFTAIISRIHARRRLTVSGRNFRCITFVPAYPPIQAATPAKAKTSHDTDPMMA